MNVGNNYKFRLNLKLNYRSSGDKDKGALNPKFELQIGQNTYLEVDWMGIQVFCHLATDLTHAFEYFADGVVKFEGNLGLSDCFDDHCLTADLLLSRGSNSCELGILQDKLEIKIE